jgi:phage/plasmid-like protein (TIGR03299 family)
MTQEKMVDLNQNVLIGFTSKRGNAWHYRAEDQGVESNHYEGAIPVADVTRRLFNWDAIEGYLTITSVAKRGRKSITVRDPSRKAIMRSDTGAVLGIFKQGYKIHPYSDWLISNVETILDADLQVGSAGLLKGGAVAWVQVEMEETLNVKGVEFRPFVTAATSLDGSLATVYQSGSQLVVCDNTLSAALASKSDRFKIRHSSLSLGKISDARDALSIVYQVADNFSAQIEALTSQVVTDKQWADFVKAYTEPSTESSWATSIAQGKASELDNLWSNDVRVAPWAGSAFGVVQAVNTFTHHFQTVRNTSRVDRNMERVVTGGVDKLDRATLALLDSVMA